MHSTAVDITLAETTATTTASVCSTQHYCAGSAGASKCGMPAPVLRHGKSSVFVLVGSAMRARYLVCVRARCWWMSWAARPNRFIVAAWLASSAARGGRRCSTVGFGSALRCMSLMFVSSVYGCRPGRPRRGAAQIGASAARARRGGEKRDYGRRRAERVAAGRRGQRLAARRCSRGRAGQ
eukprot:3444055-Lingulodinium_polyedra.AAC.1